MTAVIGRPSLASHDAFMRFDFERAATWSGYAARAGLTVALTPSGTAVATPGRLEELKGAGLSRIAVS